MANTVELRAIGPMRKRAARGRLEWEALKGAVREMALERRMHFERARCPVGDLSEMDTRSGKRRARIQGVNPAGGK